MENQIAPPEVGCQVSLDESREWLKGGPGGSPKDRENPCAQSHGSENRATAVAIGSGSAALVVRLDRFHQNIRTLLDIPIKLQLKPPSYYKKI